MSEYIDIEKQIEKLQLQGLHFKDINTAKIIIKTHGFYNLINGYREQYMHIDYETKQKRYNENVSFEQIYSIFRFDQLAREAVLIAIIDFENHLKAVLSDIIGSAFGINHEIYLQRNKYRDKYVSNPRFTRNEILYTMEKIAKQSTREPINHYRKNHGVVPPWILFTDISFATLVNFVKFLKRPERELLVHTLYGEEVDEDNLDSFKDFLYDTLFMCLDYRNKAAHGGRIYNFIPRNTLRPFDGARPREGLPQLYFALEYLQYDTPFTRFTAGLSSATNFYCKSFHTKEDVALLEASTGFTITAHNYVWLNRSSSIIHRNQHCGGASNLQRIDLADIQSQNYLRCKKCFRQNI